MLFCLLLAWLLNRNVQKLVLVVKGTESGQTLERWAFDCAVDNAGVANENNELR